MTNFEKMVGVLFNLEGGESNNPADPGGHTNLGITQTALTAAIAKGIVPQDTTISSLNTDKAQLIYKAMYWDVVHGDNIPWPLCCYVFDAAVNQGPNVAIKMMQRAFNLVQDGVFGPATLNALQGMTQWHCARYMAFRVMRYQSTYNFNVFGEGWLIRCFELTMRMN